MENPEMHTITSHPVAMFVLALLAIGVSTSAAAQGMDEAQMKQMMQNAQKMQACMNEVDQSAMEAMANEGKAFQAKVESLCAAGKRKEAMAEAMTYGKRMQASPELKKMRECGKYMQGMMPDVPVPDAAKDGGKHICDE